MASSPPGLQGWDIVIVVLFFAVVVAIGIYVSILCKVKTHVRLGSISEERDEGGPLNSINNRWLNIFINC